MLHVISLARQPGDEQSGLRRPRDGRFGKWKAFGGADLGVRGDGQDLRVEVEWCLELERLARFKRRREMKPSPVSLMRLKRQEGRRQVLLPAGPK